MDTDQPRPRSRVNRMALIIGLAVVFAITAACIKGNDRSVRDAIGNISGGSARL